MCKLRKYVRLKKQIEEAKLTNTYDICVSLWMHATNPTFAMEQQGEENNHNA